MKFRRHDLEKKERRIASHRVSPPTSACSSFPASLSPFPPARRLASSFVVYRGWNRRENINFSVPRPTYASFPFVLLLHLLLLQDPSRPWDFLGHGSVIWCPTDDRFLSLPSTSPFNPGRSLGSSIMVLSAPLGPAHAENGYPSFLRAHHLSLDAGQELETSRPFLQPSQV